MIRKKFVMTGRKTVWLVFWVVIVSMTLEAADAIAPMIKPGTELFKGNVPMDVISWFWAAILAGYTGCTQFLQAMESRTMPEGKFTYGNLMKLQKLMFTSLAVVVYGTIINVKFGAQIGLSGLYAAFLADALCYVVGRRYIETQKFHDGVDIDGDGQVDENDDLNEDGVIDWRDIQMFYHLRNMEITEEKAKELAKRMFDGKESLELQNGLKKTEEEEKEKGDDNDESQR